MKHLPVVDRSGRLIGIISRGDLLRAFLPADGEIQLEVRQKLREGTFAGDAIHVHVDDGVVTLAGHLAWHRDVEEAMAIAEAVEG